MESWNNIRREKAGKPKLPKKRATKKSYMGAEAENFSNVSTARFKSLMKETH